MKRRPLSKEILFDQLHLLFYTSFIPLLILLPVWFFWDSISVLKDFGVINAPLEKPVTGFFEHHHEDNSHLLISSVANRSHRIIILLVMSGLTNFGQHISVFRFTSRVTIRTYTIFNMGKRFFVILFSIWYFKDAIGLWNGLGIALTLFGVALYNLAKLEVLSQQQKLPD
jgi:solute carrier family 35 protein E1